MGVATQRTAIEALRDETRGVQRAFDPCHPETPRAEPRPIDRRGPMRPAGLAPARKRLSPWTVRTLFRFGDLIGLAAAMLATAAFSSWRPQAAAEQASVAQFLVATALLAWSLGAIDVYRLARSETLIRHLVRLASGCGLGAGAVFLVAFAFQSRLERPDLSAWFCFSAATLTALHGAWWALVRRWRREGRLTPNIVIVGATENAARLIERITANGDAAVLGVFDDRLARAPKTVAGIPVIGDTDALIGHDIMPYVDRIVITVSPLARSRVSELFDRLATLPNPIMLFVDHDTELGQAASVSRIVDLPLAPLTQTDDDERRALIKRIADLVIGMTALIVAAPILAAVALAIRLDSPGPILFRQRRVGFNNETFTVYKFRSMRDAGSDQADRDVRQVCVNDDRVTRVGRFIRRTSLDELPQIFNVLLGQMSLVGPRPHASGMMTGEVESAHLVAGYAHRHRIKPGLTGWAAINGSRGPVDTIEGLSRRVALDIEYIERQSLWFDLAIMALTIPCLLGDREAVR